MMIQDDWEESIRKNAFKTVNHRVGSVVAAA